MTSSHPAMAAFTLAAASCGILILTGLLGCQQDLVDGRFTERQWAHVRELSPLPPLPPSPTNRHADSPPAAALGKIWFSDPGFSADGRVSCKTCHDPARLFTDGRTVAEALGRGRRNAPSTLLSPYGRWQLWDGAADSLWSQPILALENPREHGTSRLALAHRIAAVYRDDYEALFGPLPPLQQQHRFAAAGMPSDAAWEAMADDDRRAVNAVAANFGKAMEAHLRATARLIGSSPFDHYVAGDRAALSPRARDGLLLFLTRGCVQCHAGPLLSDGDFHNLRVPDDPASGPDIGRQEGLATALTSALRADGPFSDAPASWPLVGYAPHDSQKGQFKTPSLRGAALTAPYGHAGVHRTLDEVIRHDAMGGLPADDPRAAGLSDPSLLPFAISDPEVAALSAFIQSLTPDARTATAGATGPP